MWLGRLGILALAVLTSAAASAQTPPKKKKPKKPKTEQREPEKEKEKEKEEEPVRPPSRSDDPAPIDTNLREEDSAAPNTNPWVKSGIAKKKGVVAPSPDGSNSNRAAEGTSSGSGKVDWSSNLDDKPAGTSKSKDHDWVSRPIAVAVTGGYATESLRLGFGVRVGYSVSDTFYIGGAFHYHLGTKFTDSDGGEITYGAYYPAAEGGYDYHVQNFTIRPYAGIGMFVLTVSGTDSPLRNANALCVYPGIQADYQIGPGFIGLDARVLFVLQEGSSTSIGFFGVGGLRF